jgi:hypothetical protein
MKNNSIIPITFMSGTGGNFLCSFIVAAKNNNQSSFQLSEHGNMHSNAIKDIATPAHSIEYIDQHKINSIIEAPINSNIIPYYTSSHIVDLNLVNTYFHKSIRIIYSTENIPEIGYTYVGKFFVDEKQYIKNMSVLYTMTINNLYKYQQQFTNQDVTNVLYISWDDLYKDDITLLLDKISKFTSIDVDKFNISNIIHWRERTSNCIKQIQQSVLYKYNKGD